ncbi:MAG: hypothetical protein U5L09_10160 [Bacteroidales bacterium]|nr:hypothetical protein [Bacteroidales bacterium]
MLYTYLKYGRLHHVFDTSLQPEKIPHFSSIIMVTGIANPYPLEEELVTHCNELIQYSYPDHYRYKKKDLRSSKRLMITSSQRTKQLLPPKKMPQGYGLLRVMKS